MAKADKQEAARAKSPTRPVAQDIHAKLAEAFGDAVELVDAVDPYTVVTDVDRFLDVMTHLKETTELRFDFLRSITGVDWPDDGVIESVYHLYSYPLSHAHVIKYRCPRAAPEVPSVEGLWPVANWFEREQYDLFGIIYLHHSDLRRIMLPDDWVGHPLRKDYIEEEDYRGIGTTRASPLEMYAKMDESRRKKREARGEADPPPVQSSVTPPDDWVDPKEKKRQAAAAKAKADSASATDASDEEEDTVEATPDAPPEPKEAETPEVEAAKTPDAAADERSPPAEVAMPDAPSLPSEPAMPEASKPVPPADPPAAKDLPPAAFPTDPKPPPPSADAADDDPEKGEDP